MGMRVFAPDGALDDILRSAVKGVVDVGLAKPLPTRNSDGSCNYQGIRSAGMPGGLTVRSAWGGTLMSITWQVNGLINYSGEQTVVSIDFGRSRWSASRAYDAIVAAVGRKAQVSDLLDSAKGISLGPIQGTLGYA